VVRFIAIHAAGGAYERMHIQGRALITAKPLDDPGLRPAMRVGYVPRLSACVLHRTATGEFHDIVPVRVGEDAVPPHPFPLPEGEGEPSVSLEAHA
jgi:hypothetical protein